VKKKFSEVEREHHNELRRKREEEERKRQEMARLRAVAKKEKAAQMSKRRQEKENGGPDSIPVAAAEEPSLGWPCVILSAGDVTIMLLPHVGVAPGDSAAGSSSSRLVGGAGPWWLVPGLLLLLVGMVLVGVVICPSLLEQSTCSSMCSDLLYYMKWPLQAFSSNQSTTGN